MFKIKREESANTMWKVVTMSTPCYTVTTYVNLSTNINPYRVGIQFLFDSNWLYSYGYSDISRSLAFKEARLRMDNHIFESL